MFALCEIFEERRGPFAALAAILVLVERLAPPLDGLRPFGRDDRATQLLAAALSPHLGEIHHPWARGFS